MGCVTVPPAGVDITAGRLHLRAWQAGDEDVLLEAEGDAAVQRRSPVPLGAEHVRRWIGGTSVEGWTSGRAPNWAVCDSTTGEVLAHVGLRRDGDEDVWEVGFWCRPSARGQGVVPQAVAVVCRWAFAELGAARIEWRAEVGDWPSRRTAEKAGFVVEGVLRHGLVLDRARADGWLGALLPQDPAADTAALPPLGRPTDGVVALRHWREQDLPFVAAACDDPQTARWLPVPVPYTPADARAWALGTVPREWADGTVASVAVADATTDEPLGAVGLTLGRAGVAEVGYWTAPQVRGRGVAVRAARLHTAWGVQALGLARVELLTDPGNVASQRVADKAGFVREGVARAVRPAPRSPERVDMVVWAHVP
jgi:RimJ/RimL family protein N-acetyltransferase